MSGQGPSILLRKTVLSLKSPTGAFIAPLRCANANLFNKVQEKLAKNKKAPARHKAEESYLLTTKLYCGKCGALMFGESGVSHTGKMYTYYKCAAAKKKKTCDKKAVRKQWLEDLVVNETMKLVEDDASMNAIIAKVMELQNQESTDLPIYEKQLKETEVGITNMLNAIQMGILTSSTKERLEALEEQRKELQARIAEERLAKPKMKEESSGSIARADLAYCSDRHILRYAIQRCCKRLKSWIAMVAPFPQAGYDPAGAAAGTDGHLHQCHLSLR